MTKYTPFILLAAVLAVCVVLSMATAQPARRLVFHGYVHIRPGGVTANDAELTADAMAWNTVRDWVQIPEDWQSVSVSLYAYGDGVGAGDPHGAVVDCNLYVAHEFGSAMHVCRFSAEVGHLRLSHDPAYGPGSQYRSDELPDVNHKWAEGPFVLTEDFWRTPVRMSGKVDGVGELNFNHNGATHIRVNLDNMTDATRWHVVMTGRK